MGLTQKAVSYGLVDAIWIEQVGTIHSLLMQRGAESFPSGSYYSFSRIYRRLLLADPFDRPELSRKVVRLPLLDADPMERPLAFRNVV